jgi:DNA-binding Lrp family transcriptional regulator
MSDPQPEQVYQFVLQNGKPFATTSDVAEEFEEVSKKTVWKRLDKLEAAGKIQKEKIGANAVVWYPPCQAVEDAKASNPSSDIQ